MYSYTTQHRDGRVNIQWHDYDIALICRKFHLWLGVGNRTLSLLILFLTSISHSPRVKCKYTCDLETLSFHYWDSFSSYPELFYSYSFYFKDKCWLAKISFDFTIGCAIRYYRKPKWTFGPVQYMLKHIVIKIQKEVTQTFFFINAQLLGEGQ